MVSAAWVCECDYWTTSGRMYHEMDDIEADAGGIICPECGEHLAPGTHRSGSTGIASQEERVSLAMGVHPDQIEAAMKKYPGSRYRPDGALLYNGRAGQKAAMKARGYVNYN